MEGSRPPRLCHSLQRRHAGREHGRLGAFGGVELLLGTFLDQLPQVIAQHRGSFIERGPHDRVGLRKRRKHADRLGPLAGEHESKGHFHSHPKNPTDYSDSVRGLRHAAMATPPSVPNRWASTTTPA